MLFFSPHINAQKHLPILLLLSKHDKKQACKREREEGKVANDETITS